MVQMMLEVSEDLAERIRPLSAWLPTVLELSLVGCQTQAVATATDVIDFLSTDPTPQEVLAYQVSNDAQSRLRRLLTLNEAGLLSEVETRELDELQQIEHIIIMLKIQIMTRLSSKPY